MSVYNGWTPSIPPEVRELNRRITRMQIAHEQAMLEQQRAIEEQESCTGHKVVFEDEVWMSLEDEEACSCRDELGDDPFCLIHGTKA